MNPRQMKSEARVDDIRRLAIQKAPKGFAIKYRLLFRSHCGSAAIDKAQLSVDEINDRAWTLPDVVVAGEPRPRARNAFSRLQIETDVRLPHCRKDDAKRFPLPR
jgi:hypothetical protein